MGVYLEKNDDKTELAGPLLKIAGVSLFDAYRFCDDFEGEPKLYSVWKIVTDGGVFVLKKPEDDESYSAEIEHYRLLKGLPAPEFLGAADGYVLTRFAEGEDLKTASDGGVTAAARSLAAIMNAYPPGRDFPRERYDVYIKRLRRRASSLKDEPELAAAFRVFLDRQLEIPLTLSNSDLLPINVLFDGERAVIIDWEFGGFMPYSLDVIRFTAHGCEDGSTPFYMTEAHKKLFHDTVYGLLETRPDRARYDRDLLLGELNECVEMLEWYFNDPTAERDGVFRYYYERARALAKRITGER